MQVYKLNNFSCLDVTGPDAEKFLQGQVSCDMSKVTIANAIRGCHCTAQGRIIADFYVTAIDGGYQLICVADVIEILQKALQKFAVFSKVALTINDCDLFAVISDSEVTVAGLRVINFPADSNNYLAIGELPSEFRKLAAAIETKNDSDWQLWEMQNGIAHISAAISGKLLPHEINYQHSAVLDFDKGCYIGQEIIARMHYRGKSKFVLALFSNNAAKSESQFLAGDAILNEHNKKIGLAIASISQGSENFLLASILADVANSEAQLQQLNLTTIASFNS